MPFYLTHSHRQLFLASNAWAAIACICILAIFFPTAETIFRVWSTSETFTHGFLIFPAFLWLVWRKRTQLKQLEQKPYWPALLYVFAFGGMWLVFNLSGILVGQQIALVCILICTIWGAIGIRRARIIRFPLYFLIYLAPVGEELVPILMELTADITIWAIRITEVPVYREGLFFSLPTGNWSIVEACSGVRYLIASVVLGNLFAYTTYTNYKLRVVFILFSTLIPILANSARAYLIVMLGHLSNNKIATGVDHLVYGWVFFGIVMFILFSTGETLKKFDHATTEQSRSTSGHFCSTSSTTSNTAYPVFFLMVISCTLIWPAWSKTARSSSEFDTTRFTSDSFLPLSTAPSTEKKEQYLEWQPLITGHDFMYNSVYAPDATSLPIYAKSFVFIEQVQGKEMITSTNTLVKSTDNNWRLVETEKIVVRNDTSRNLTIEQSKIKSNDSELIVWKWYSAGNFTTSDPWMVKIIELAQRISFQKNLSITYILYADSKAKDLKKRLTKIVREVSTIRNLESKSTSAKNTMKF